MDNQEIEFLTVTDRDRSWAASFAENDSEGLLVFDTNCRYRFWSPVMERMSGVSCAKCVGEIAFDVFPFLKHSGEDRYFLTTLQGGEVSVRNRPYVVASTGRYGLFDAEYGPLRNQQGEVIGGYAIIRDVTERYLHEQFRASTLPAMPASRAESFKAQSSELVNPKVWLRALGLAVKQRRMLMDLSQEEFAFRAGLHRTYITDVERGVRNVSMSSFLKLSQALQLDSWVLTGYTELLTKTLESEQDIEE